MMFNFYRAYGFAIPKRYISLLLHSVTLRDTRFFCHLLPRNARIFMLHTTNITTAGALVKCQGGDKVNTFNFDEWNPTSSVFFFQNRQKTTPNQYINVLYFHFFLIFFTVFAAIFVFSAICLDLHCDVCYDPNYCATCKAGYHLVKGGTCARKFDYAMMAYCMMSRNLRWLITANKCM